MNIIEIIEHATKCARDNGTLNDNPYRWDTQTAEYMQWKTAYCKAKRGE